MRRRDLGFWICGLAAGLFAGLLLPGDAPVPIDASGGADALPAIEAGAPTLSGRSGVDPAMAAPASIATTSATSRTDEAQPPATAIQVSFPAASRERIQDVVAVYALPAGAEGVDDVWEVPHADADSDYRIPLFAGGRYDVGCLYGLTWTLVQDVHVKAGEVVALPIELSAPATVQLAFDGPIGDDDQIDVTLSSTGEGLEAPGRGEQRSTISAYATRGTPSVTPTLEVPPNGIVQVSTSVRRHVDGDLQPAFDVRTVAPATAAAGDVVRIELRPGARADLVFVGEPLPPEQTVVAVEIAIDGRLWSVVYVQIPAHEVALATAEPYVSAPIEPDKRTTISWSGRGILSGSVEVPPVPRGAAERAVVRVKPQTDWGMARAWFPTPTGSTLALRIEGLSDGDLERYGLIVYGRFPDHFGIGDEGVPVAELDGTEAELPAPFSEALEVGAVCGPFGVARARRISGGEVVLSFEEGGYVVVVCDPPVPSNIGWVRVGRADGLPVSSLYSESSIDDPSRAIEGRIIVPTMAALGPFPSGPLTLRAWVGSTRLSDLHVVVRPGRISTVAIRR